MTSDKIETVSSSLQLDEDIELQKRGWIIQKVCIALLILFVLLAALGLFGNGLLSNKKLSTQESVLEYDRFLRHEGQARLVFEQLSDSLLEIEVPGKYLKAFELDKIVPAPIETEIVKDHVLYRFWGAPPYTITLSFEPQETGVVQAVLKANQTQYHITHFIYP